MSSRDQDRWSRGHVFVPRAAFTLVELLVVIAIIGTLIALLIPAVQSARESARRVTCGSNVKQLAIAIHAFHDANNRLPPGGAINPSLGTSGTALCGTLTAGTTNVDGRAPWSVYILHYIGDVARYDQFDLTQSFNGYMPDTLDGATPAANSANYAEQVKANQAFECPSANTRASVGRGNYRGVQGGGTPACTTVGGGGAFYTNGVMFLSSRVKFSDVTDGTSKTLLLGENGSLGMGASSLWNRTWATAYRTQWFSTSNNYSDALSVGNTTAMINGTSPANGFGSKHSQGAMFAVADAAVVFLSQDIDIAIYQSLGIRNDALPRGGF